MPGPAPSYLAKYNSYTLPGYVQSESMDSASNIAVHSAAYVDGGLSENLGLENKVLSLRLKVWEDDYLACKNKVELAATMLRSSRTYANLYVQYSDRHYVAMPKEVSTSKTAGESVKMLEYEVNFDCKPWLIKDDEKVLTGTGLIDTDQVTRTIEDGGWTPTVVNVTGTDITISGYTATGDYTGFISISGYVTDFTVHTELFQAYTASGYNGNLLMNNADFRLYVGPGKTYFDVTGASACEITYHDRWYI